MGPRDDARLCQNPTLSLLSTGVRCDRVADGSEENEAGTRGGFDWMLRIANT